jgi:phosphoribosyl 1,2-cyclic phosphodiesterase
MRFSVLASGSGGNACYVETAHSRILIDAGLSCRQLIKRLEGIEVEPESLDALIITHEHLDHIKGAGPLARRLDIPVYISGSTLKNGIKILGNLSRPVVLHTGQTFPIKDLLIETFTKCHDAVDPMGLILSSDGVRLGMVTDLGRSTRLVEDRLKGCHALIIEFNHDHRMLEEGPYPWVLKSRIKGPEGHLSNQQAGELLKAVAHKNLSQVVLAHLSEINNHTQKAFQEARDMLVARGLDNTRILISRQDNPVPMVEL